MITLTTTLGTDKVESKLNRNNQVIAQTRIQRYGDTWHLFELYNYNGGRGDARRTLYEALQHINGTITLEASGSVNQGTETLEQFYQRLGFSIVQAYDGYTSMQGTVEQIIQILEHTGF